MKLYLDFHIHSRFSRATSQQMNIPNLALWAAKKGINILGTGDFTHPLWWQEIKANLKLQENGFFSFKDSPTLFVLSAEISSIYSKKGKVYKIHNCILAPSFEVVEKIQNRLNLIGNLKSDGRPILGIDAKELLKIILAISPECLIIPAHIWTPHFSLFGANSGFDSLEECFEDLSGYIFAIETGLSSDPPMNWRISELDSRAIISSSDSHSPMKLGREVTFFEIKDPLSYDLLVKMVKEGGTAIPKTLNSRLLGTIEFFPEEGKYHYTGHRNCGIVYSPEELQEKGSLCPVCHKKLTIGVAQRVEELAKRPSGFKPENALEYFHLVPLLEVVSLSLGVKGGTKAESIYKDMIQNFGSEFKILLKTPIKDLELFNPNIAFNIQKIREGELEIEPGYDGIYGKIKLKEAFFNNQLSLFEI